MSDAATEARMSMEQCGRAHDFGLKALADLEKELAAERKRREESDTRIREALEQIRKAFAERGAATPGGGFAGILAGVHDLADRAEQAEADNAALLEGVEALSGMSLSEPTRAAFLARLRTEPHPGAALLEYVRALETVVEVATEALGALSLPSGPACDKARTGAYERLAAALCAADALKERKP